MDASQWPQQQVASLERKMEQVVTQHNTISDNINANHHHDPTNNNAIRASPPMVVERRARPQKDQNLNCPRCNSTNTKFCYYNNYSLTQPRYFCKSCRRYWTHGGSLRNVPMGGGSRRNRRSSTSSSTLAPSSMNVSTIPNKIMLDLNPPSSLPHLITPSQNPKFLEGQDLNLGFPIQGFFQPLDQHQLPKIEASNNNVTNNENNEPIHIMNINIPNASTTTSCTTTSQLSCGVNSGENNNHNNALELLRTRIASNKGSLSSFVPMPLPDSNTLYPQIRLFSNLQEVKQSTNLGVFASHGDHNHHHGNNGYEHMVGSGANARLLFPFVDMNKLANSTPNHHHHHEIDEHNGRNEHHPHNHNHNQAPTSSYWTSMLGGGTW